MSDRCTRTHATFIALIAGLPLLSGCSDRNADSRKIAEAARDLGSVGSATSSSSYTSVAASMSSLDVNGETATAVASGLLSQSLQGQGSVAISAATISERTLFDELDKVLSLGRRFEALSTTAVAMDAFDPAADIERIEARSAQLRAEALEQRSARSDLAGKIADLESRVATLESDSTSKRNQAAEMKLASASLSAVEAAARAGSIRSLSRQADALDMQISQLSGEAATLRPRLTEIDAELSKLEEQQELALQSTDELREMARSRAVQSETARAEARDIADQIRTAVNAIDGTREESVIPAGEEATTSLEKAIRESDKTARKVRAAGNLGKTTAQRRLAELLHLRAHGHERFALTLRKLSMIEGLPGASAFAEAADEEAAAASDLRGLAADAYESAATSLTSVNIRGTDSDKAQETADRLRDLALLLRGEGDVPAPPAEPAP